MVAEGSWRKARYKDTNILDLTNKYKAIKNSMSALEEHIKKLFNGEKSVSFQGRD